MKIDFRIVHYIKIFLIMSSIFSTISCCDPWYEINDEVIAFRRAVPKDIASMLDLYNDMKEEDFKQLIVIPRKYREDYLKKVIDNKYLYGAFDTQGKALAMIQVYLLDDQSLKEKHKMFGYDSARESDLAYKYLVTEERLQNRCKLLQKKEPCGGKYRSYDSQVRLYYGSSYTRHASRGKGIMSELSLYAYCSLQEAIKKKLYNQKTGLITLLYGQVKNNIHHEFIVRTFAKFLYKIFMNGQKRPYTMKSWGYDFKLPSYVDIGTDLQEVRSNIIAVGFFLSANIVKDNGNVT